MRHHLMALHHNHTGLGAVETVRVTSGLPSTSYGTDSSPAYEVEAGVRFWSNSYIVESHTLFGSVISLQYNPGTDFVIPHRTITSGNEIYFRYEPVAGGSTTSTWESYKATNSEDPNTWYAISSTDPRIRLYYTHPTTPLPGGGQIISLRCTVKLSSTASEAGLLDSNDYIIQISTQDV